MTARALLSHTTPSTAFRGFGTPQASWAVESQLNAAASALGIDRLEIRRRNVAKRGEAFIPGDTPADGDWEGVLQQSRQRNRLDRSSGGRAWPGRFARPQELFDGVVFVRDRSRALRRERFDPVGHVGHGPGRANGAEADRRRGARHRSGPHRHRDGRHLGGAVRLLHVRKPFDGLHGECRCEGLPGREGEAQTDGDSDLRRVGLRRASGQWERRHIRPRAELRGVPARAFRPAARRGHRHRA